jgi:hypothetical protein
MAPKDDYYNKYLKEKNITYIRRKQIQMENREGYENALESLKVKIIEEEGAEKRDELRKDRTAWITDRIAQAKFPDDLDQYYTVKQSSTGTGNGNSSAGGKAEEKDRRDSKGSKGSKGDKGEKEEKEGKTNKGKKSDKTGKDEGKEKDEGKGKEKEKGGGMDASAMSKPQPKSEVSPLSLTCLREQCSQYRLNSSVHLTSPYLSDLIYLATSPLVFCSVLLCGYGIESFLRLHHLIFCNLITFSIVSVILYHLISSYIISSNLNSSSPSIAFTSSQ